MKIRYFAALAGALPAFAGALMVGACGGFSSIGGEEPGGAGGEAGDTSGGTSGSGMGKGGTSGKSGSGGASGTTGMGGTMQTGGTTGMGGGGSHPCAGKPCGAACSTCDPGVGDPAMGGCDLALRYCDASGECGVAFPVCENECETTMDCAASMAPCQICPDGTTQCPTVECRMGQCVSSYPSCGVECMSDMDCPVVAAPCQMCPDGTASCPTPDCVNGRCSTGWPGCGGVDPCSGKSCGQPCFPCEAQDCADPGLMFVCNAEGKCAAEAPSCPGSQCMTDEECVASEICGMCVGATSCIPLSCVNGACQTVCPPAPPECDVAEDCMLDDICRVCPDMTCAETACIDHECKTVCDAL